MGTLDQSTATSVVKEIRIVDVTGKTPEQIENVYNSNYGKKGWRIIQIFEKGTKTYILCEREV